MDNQCSIASGGIFLFIITLCRLTLGSTQPPIQWAEGAVSAGLKQPGHEADYSPHLVLRLRMLYFQP